MEIELPSVKKPDMDLKVLSGGFMVEAPKGDIEYQNDYAFCCPEKTEKTEASGEWDDE